MCLIHTDLILTTKGYEMTRTSFITRNEIAKLIQTAQANKTGKVQHTFTEKQTIYIFKYLKRTDAWTRQSKTTYINSNSTLQVQFLSSTQIRLTTKKGA